MNSTLTGAVAMYLSQVRAELSDLPPGEFADVLDDVSGHLTEVAAEFDTEPTIAALHERLGTPRQYADELRTAAGYPPRTTKPPVDQNPAEKALTWGLIATLVGPFLIIIAIFAGGEGASAFVGFVGFVFLFGGAYLGVRALRGNDPRSIIATPRGQRGERAVRELIEQIPPNLRKELVTIGQPVWWVLRGAVGGGGFFLIFGAGAVAVVGAIVGAVVSVWVARRTQQDQRWLWYVVPLNVVAAIAVPAFLSAAFLGAYSNVFDHSTSNGSSNYNPPSDGLRWNGNEVTNLYPFDAQGKQTSVALYTQDGEAVTLPLQDCMTQNNIDRNNATAGTSNIVPHTVAATVEPPSASISETDPPVEPVCNDVAKAPFAPPQFPTAGPTTGPTPGPTPTPPAASKPVTSTKPTTPPSKPGTTLTVQPSR
ncbi:hypothetical protein OG474_18305 [Kribbella sp. NBC_01505]|uniref:HAAS signaling domain-containing protein n=1 Tax=Kribbella sp. NBC_01505 TaxID=2903580 RepID=UPI00386922FA